MTQIILSMNVAVSNGPTLAPQRTIEVEAYDKIDLDIPAGASEKEVTLQPGAAGQVQLIAIVSDAYSDDLSYKINNTGADVRTLDQPHFLAGKGAVSLFDDPPSSLFFTNNATADATVQILIGRDATP